MTKSELLRAIAASAKPDVRTEIETRREHLLCGRALQILCRPNRHPQPRPTLRLPVDLIPFIP